MDGYERHEGEKSEKQENSLPTNSANRRSARAAAGQDRATPIDRDAVRHRLEPRGSLEQRLRGRSSVGITRLTRVSLGPATIYVKMKTRKSSRYPSDWKKPARS